MRSPRGCLCVAVIVMVGSSVQVHRDMLGAMIPGPLRLVLTAGANAASPRMEERLVGQGVSLVLRPVMRTQPRFDWHA